jgi:hypothetical protein
MKRVISLTLLLTAAAFSVAQGHGGMHFRFQGSDGGTMVQLAQRPDVQKELGATPDETTKLADLETRMETAVGAGMTDLTKGDNPDPNTIRNGIQAIGDKFALELPTILTADQDKRLRELLIQRAGFSAAQRKDVQDELGLTDDQRAKIKGATADMLKTFDGLRGEVDAKKIQDEAKAAIDTRNKAIEDAMTPDQRTKFEAMKGKPFTFDEDKKGKN